MRDLPCADRRIPQTLFHPLEIAFGCIEGWAGSFPLLTTSDRTNWGVLLPVQTRCWPKLPPRLEPQLHHRSVSREIGTFEALFDGIWGGKGVCVSIWAVSNNLAHLFPPMVSRGTTARGLRCVRVI